MTGLRRSSREILSASGFGFVVIGAALWGSDAFFRRTLALELPATVIVAAEHLIITALLLPVVWASRDALKRFGPADWLSLVVIGSGSSAFATVLFTMSFTYGDPNTPLLLQKLQPLFAVGAAAVILRERVGPRFFVFLAVAMSGAYLITFPDPWAVGFERLAPAVLAIGAAVLWAMGTVLGRRMTALVSPTRLTALRITIGLAVLAPIAVVQNGFADSSRLIADSFGPLILLALVPGLLALLVYYRGLKSTPASAASIAELAFPLTAVCLNYLAFDAVLTGSQVLGLAVLSGTVVTMAWLGRGVRGAPRLGVTPVAARSVTRMPAS